MAASAAAAPPAGGVPSAADQAIAADLLSYLNASVTEFHAVEEARQRLLAAGFTQLSERAPWEGLERGGRYFFTRWVGGWVDRVGGWGGGGWEGGWGVC